MADRKKDWLDKVPPWLFSAIYSPAIIAQFVLAFFRSGELRVVRLVGYGIWVIGVAFAFVPMFQLKRRGDVPEGEIYMKTSRLVDSGIYSIVRHPQYLAGMLFSMALMLVTQDWLVILLGLPTIVLTPLDAILADRDCIDKFGDAYRKYMRRVPQLNAVLGVMRKLF